MKKIKVFLGGYLNYTNAQNLNCRALAKYLDKAKFEVSAMLCPGGNLSIDEDLDHVKFYKLRRPVRFWRYITYLRGILSCDVAYLPKGEIFEFNEKILNLFRKKSFCTIEGVIDGTNYEKTVAFVGSKEKVSKLYSYTNSAFSITQYMAIHNRELHGIKSDGVLYLGVEFDKFQQSHKTTTALKNIVFIGNNMKYKGVDEIYELSKLFPEISFNIVGGGMDYDANKEIAEKNLTNVIYHGLLDHNQIKELLKYMDLHVFPSRSEGFPKVTLETAAAGVPSIVYSDYGASEWITSGKSGFVVDTFEEIVKIISDLKQNPENLQSLRKEAVAMARRFDWKVLINDWENAIFKLAQSSRTK